MGNLTTLSDMKLMLSIPDAVTTSDTLLTLLIAQTSRRIETYLSRVLGYADYVEPMAPSFVQVLQMPQWPIRKVTSIYSQEQLLTPDVDYFTYKQYTESGEIYRGQTWWGPTYVRGLTSDPYAGQFILVVTYSAGYDLPGSTPPVGIDAYPLPEDISLVCQMMVAQTYNDIKRRNLGGDLSSYSEGGISMSWDHMAERNPDSFLIMGGMTSQFASILNPYKKWALA